MNNRPRLKDISGCVLIVDNDDTTRLLVRSVLSDAGYQVLTAVNGADGLEQFAAHHIDCIVTDVHMPNLNGFELCAMVRVMPGGERVQILFMTGQDDYDLIERAYETGANDFATKHANPVLLLERVRFLFRAQRMQDALRLSEQRLAYAQRLATLGHWERTLDGRTLAVSRVVCQLLSVDDPDQLTWRGLCAQTHPDDLSLMQLTMQRAITNRSNFRLEHRVINQHGTLRVLRHQGEVVFDNNNWTIRSTIQDVTETRAQEDRIRFLAFHDPLTALPNRESATRTLKLAIKNCAARQEHVAVFALWLDDFNRVASSLGQHISDAVLKTMGDRLRSQIRGSDHVVHGNGQDTQDDCVVARADGDKFLIVVSNLHLSETAISIAKCLQRAVTSPVAMGDTELQLSASVGVSLYPDDGDNAEELVDNAFTALMHTDGQKGSCQFFATEISSRARQRLTLEAELRQAIEANQFQLHFQPRIRLADSSVHGAEALVRWQHPTRGLIMPGDFIPLAEEIGLIAPLGRLVIDMATRQAAQWRCLFGKQFRISINISPLQFGAGNLIEDLDEAVQREHAHYENLEVEITESALMSRPEVVINALHAFRERGLRLALDDFGTGFSSLSYLRKLPLDVLKIDRSFVADIGTTRNASSLVNAILSMAHALGLSCVAEGVEQESQLSFLAVHHCHEVQGFLFARPMAAEDFERWLRNWQAAQLNDVDSKIA
jgi:diguanylate cyclase (GGDEF)-like protein